MKTAVVFGARQPFGFELCCQLLEKGYSVYAIEHHQWITQEQEENWLLIGRNANLKYMELKNDEGPAQQLFSGEEYLYIIPSIDYLSRNHANVRNHLMLQLKNLLELEKTKSLLLIHPSVTGRNESSFAGKLNGLFESIKKKHQVREYCISDSLSKGGNAMVLISGAGDGQGKTADGNSAGLRENVLSTAAEEVVSYIEQHNLLKMNN